jgi:hypothetical protein
MLPSIGVQLGKELGIDITKPMTFEQRVTYQELRLDAVQKQLEGVNTVFVADRTPLDLAAYLLAEVPTSLADPVLIGRVQRYVQKCFDLTNQHFCHVTLFRPALPYIKEEGKPLENKPYQELVNLLCVGLVMDDRMWRDALVIPMQVIDRVERADHIVKMANKSLVNYADDLKLLPTC